MNVRPLARLRALGILTGTWWLHQTMFPSGLCVVVGRLASRRGRLADRRGTMVLGIMSGMEPVGRLGARRGTIVLSLKWPNRKLKGRRCVVLYYNEKNVVRRHYCASVCSTNKKSKTAGIDRSKLVHQHNITVILLWGDGGHRQVETRTPTHFATISVM